MLLAIRHFPDKKKPCIVLEEGNQALVLGYLTDAKREKWLRMALTIKGDYQIAAHIDSPYGIDEIIESEENNE